MDLDTFFGEHHRRLDRIDRQLEKIMSALDDLTATIGKIETAETVVADYVATLKAGSDETALAALNVRLTTIVTDLQELVPAAPVALAFVPATLPTPVAGTAYSQTLTTSGDTAPVTLAVDPNTPLPTGATFDGTALAWADPVSGTYSFTITATDSATPPNTATLAVSWTF